jgi:predicted ATPase
MAAELVDGSGDGVWLAELAAVTDSGAVPAAISRALRLAAQPGRPALEALLDALALQDVLIVVDYCEHLIGGSAKTAEAVQPEGRHRSVRPGPPQIPCSRSRRTPAGDARPLHRTR